MFGRMSTMNITESQIWDRLKTVIDPELKLDIVSLGLIYQVTVTPIQTKAGEEPFVHILLTLTTPGCPLSAVFEEKIKEALDSLTGLDAYKNAEIELTFDPPWIPDMMSEEARAELNV